MDLNLGFFVMGIFFIYVEKEFSYMVEKKKKKLRSFSKNFPPLIVFIKEQLFMYSFFPLFAVLLRVTNCNRRGLITRSMILLLHSL